jgi:hypothetical protein
VRVPAAHQDEVVTDRERGIHPDNRNICAPCSPGRPPADRKK